MTKEVKGDQNEGAEEKTNKKAKGKVEKKSVKSVRTLLFGICNCTFFNFHQQNFFLTHGDLI